MHAEKKSQTHAAAVTWSAAKHNLGMHLRSHTTQDRPEISSAFNLYTKLISRSAPLLAIKVAGCVDKSVFYT